MSKVFSNTTTKNGLIQRMERELGFNDGDISGDTTRLAQFTGDINSAYDEIIQRIIQASGTWQWDDSNQTDLPIIRTNINSGQRDYSFTTDGSSNIILDIAKVLILPSATATIYDEITPVDETIAIEHIDGSDTAGVPVTYSKLGNSIMLDPIPNYNATNGLKLLINREASYFATSDTTKKAGFAGIFHELLVLIPAYDYARRNNMSQVERLFRDKEKMLTDLETYYGKRERDDRKIMTPKKILYI